MDGDPLISWDEAMDPAQVQARVDATLSKLTTRLEEPTDGQHRLYFVVPTPAPYDVVESKLLSIFNQKQRALNEVKVLSLSLHGRCYAVNKTNHFCALLPLAFQFGPPEITLLAANCDFDLSAFDTVITAFVLSALKSEASSSHGKTAGLHFDSGDLVDIF